MAAAWRARWWTIRLSLPTSLVVPCACVESFLIAKGQISDDDLKLADQYLMMFHLVVLLRKFCGFRVKNVNLLPEKCGYLTINWFTPGPESI